MKIHTLNSQGTIAVVIPKQVAKRLGWEEGQEVFVDTTPEAFKLMLVNQTLYEQRPKRRLF